LNDWLIELSQAIPDVAAQGERFRVFVGGQAVSVAGTSASSPAFTGIVALLNDVRLKAGRPPLGFLNPLLYSIPEGFNDITIGNNPGCGTNGFNATIGWDAVTGKSPHWFVDLILIHST